MNHAEGRRENKTPSDTARIRQTQLHRERLIFGTRRQDLQHQVPLAQAHFPHVCGPAGNKAKAAFFCGVCDKGRIKKVLTQSCEWRALVQPEPSHASSLNSFFSTLRHNGSTGNEDMLGPDAINPGTGRELHQGPS